MRYLTSLVMAAAMILFGGAPTKAGAGPFDTPGAMKAVTCSACHGEAGNSRSDAVPILAGMAPQYFKKAIQDYASGKRPSPEMEPFSKAVLALGVDEIAQFFSSQKKVSSAIAIDREAAARGRAAAAPCASCHGLDGKGDPANSIPDLSGQPVGYLRQQMLLFKQERRSPGDAALGALKAMMKTIPDETLGDLAAYYSSLR